MPTTVHISPLLSLSLLSAGIACLFSVTACIQSDRSWFHRSAGATNVQTHAFFFCFFSIHSLTTGGFTILSSLHHICLKNGVLCLAGREAVCCLRRHQTETLSVVWLRLTGSITRPLYPRVISPALLLHKNGLMPVGRSIGQEKSL